MICTTCHFENQVNAKFCSECGTALVKVCKECGQVNPSTGKFCSECGRPLTTRKHEPTDTVVSRPTAWSERKQATILFSDLSGYTALGEKFDPEEVKNIMSRIFGGVAQIVAKYEGIIDKFIGDAVMALFGIPKAHEDDPVRAILAAMEIRKLVQDISPQYESRLGRSLSMHTGINTGLVVTGSMEVEKGLLGFTGDAINLAARLSGLAEDDQILVGPITHNQARWSFLFERLEPVQLKGKAEPTIPYRVIGGAKALNRFEIAEQRGFTPYTGREPELASLHICLEKAMAGRGQLVTVIGEAGIGKSRLIFEFRHSLDRDRITVLEGRCQTYGVDIPYNPMVNALRRGLNLQEEDHLDRLKEKAVFNIRNIDPNLEPYIPHFLHILSIPGDEYPLPQNLKGEELRSALQDALAAIITLNTKHRPMVLILEDWHWADEASESALKNLVSLLSSYPLMVVVLYRPEYEANWPGLEIHTPLVLKHLGRSNTEDIIKSVVRADTLPDGLVDMIHARTGGNPLFIEEISNSLIEQGLLVVETRRGILTRSPDDLRLPNTVQAVISTRFDQLDGKSQETLKLASVIGREFGRRILEKISPASEQLAGSLDDLKSLEIIQQIRLLPEVEYMFKHVLTQVVVYETLLHQQRRELHGLVGQAIEEFYADRLEEHYEALAHHYGKSNQFEKAIRYLELAGDKAAGYFSLGEARKHYRAAIEILESQDKSDAAKEMYIGLSLKWAEVSHYAASNEHITILEKSTQYARDIKDEAGLGKITYWMGRMYYSLGKMAQALPWFNQCIEMAENLRDDQMLALPYNVIGRTCLFTAEFTKGIAYLEKGIPMLMRLGNQDEVIYSTGLLGLIYGLTGDFEKSFQLAYKALDMSIKMENKTREAVTNLYLEVINIQRGCWKDAINNGKKVVAICRRIDNPVIEGIGIYSMGYATFHQGDRQKGHQLLRSGIEKVEATGASFTLGLGYGWWADTHALAGHKEETEFCAGKAFDLIQVGERWGEAAAYRALAIIASKEEPPAWDKVDAHMGKSLRVAEERQARPELAVGYFRYAEILHARGDLKTAGEYLARSVNLFSEMGMVWWLKQAENLKPFT